MAFPPSAELASAAPRFDLRWGALAFLGGVLTLHSLSDVPDRAWTFVGLPLALAVSWWVPRGRLLAWWSAGFCWTLWLVTPLPSAQWSHAWQGEEARVSGWVVSMPEAAYRNTRFEFVVTAARLGDNEIPLRGRLQLAWYEMPPALRVGDRWELTVRLRRSRGLANPGGFDQERWRFVNRIVAQGTVRAQPEPRLLATADRFPVDRFRQAVAERFKQQLAGDPYTGVLTALAVGDTGAIPDTQWELFRRTGTAHLISISGLHIGLIAGLTFALAHLAWGFTPLARRWPARKAAALAALLGALGYAVLAGLSVPTQRALVMIAVALVAVFSQRPVVPSRLLAIALLLVLLIDPTAPLAGGFWLSFGAVAAIFYTVVGRRGKRSALGAWIGLQLAITLALLPLTLMLFQSIPLVSPFANLIAIPWSSLTVVPLSLLAVLAGFIGDGAQLGILKLAALTLDWLWQFLQWVDRWPWAALSHPSPPLWTWLFTLPGLLLLLAPRGFPGRWLGVVLCLPAVFYPPPRPAEGAAWFTLLDVGQGLATVVLTARHVLVYDTGPRWGAGSDAGRVALAPFLRQQGVKAVDTLIISHADNAHMGGTRSLREQFPVRRILLGLPPAPAIDDAEPCQAGVEWAWDGVVFRLLHPPSDGGFSGDNASCVLQVEAAGQRILLPGDIEPPAQTALVARYGSELAAPILVAPHHGTRTLFLPAFLAAVRPRYVLLSTGDDNRFGYPRPETLASLRMPGAAILESGEEGAITFRLEPDRPLDPELYRRQSRRYWNAP